MNCKYCKYFEPFTDHERHGYKVGYGFCSHNKIVDDLALEVQKDLTMPLDGIYATCDEQRGRAACR